MNNFKTSQPGEFTLNTVDEIDSVFRDTGVMIDLSQAVDNEFIAVDVVREIFNKIKGE